MAARADATGRTSQPVIELVRGALRIGFTPTRRNILHWASWAITLTILLAMTVVLRDGNVYQWEVDFTDWAQDFDYPEWLFTLTGDNLTNSDAPQGIVIITSVCLVLWVLRMRIEAALIALSVPLHILGNFPKAIVDRERPGDLIDGITASGGPRSFPSGHAEFAITFYGYLIYVAMFYVHGRAQRALLVIGWLAIAASVNFGRISAGRHWPLDGVAGYVVGIGLLSGLIWLHRSLHAARSASENAEA